MIKKPHLKKSKNIFKSSIFFISLIILVYISSVILLNESNSKRLYISSFEECVRNGNLILESDPRQCRTFQGQLFIEENNNVSNYIDITVSLPNPHISIKNEIVFSNERDFIDIFNGNPLNINFSKKMVITIFSGEKKSGGNLIELTSLERFGDMLRLYVRETSPGDGCLMTLAIEYPFLVVELDKFELKRIEFIYSNISKSC